MSDTTGNDPTTLAFQNMAQQIGLLIQALTNSGVPAAIAAINQQLGSPFVKIVVGSGALATTLDGTTGDVTTPKFVLGGNGTLYFTGATVAASATAGAAGALPAAPGTYLEVSINGTLYLLPAYPP